MWLCLVCGNENDDEMIRCICGYEIPDEQPDINVEDKEAETTEGTDDNNSVQWFYDIDGNQTGPISAAALKTKYLAGELTAETFVWSGDNDEWHPLYYYDIYDNMRELFQKPDTVAPIQTEQENSKDTAANEILDSEPEAATREQGQAGNEQPSLFDNKTINYYCQILGFQSLPSKDEIKQAYKDLLIVWDPDRFISAPSLQQKAQKKIREIDDAYEKLLLHLAKIGLRHSELQNIANSEAGHHHNQSSEAKKPLSDSRSNYYNAVTSSAQQSSDNELGFGWGNLLIIISFLQGSLAVFMSFIGGVTTAVIPNRGIGLLMGLFGLSLGYGLLKRKKFGLYLVYINIALWLLMGAFMIVQGTTVKIVQGFIVIIIWSLWFRYFQRRNHLFQ